MVQKWAYGRLPGAPLNLLLVEWEGVCQAFLYSMFIVGFLAFPTHSQKACLVPAHALQFVSTHPLQFLGQNSVRNPALDHGRALDFEVELSDHGVAVIHLQAMVDLQQAHPLTAESAPDDPLLAGNVQLALTIHL